MGQSLPIPSIRGCFGLVKRQGRPHRASAKPSVTSCMGTCGNRDVSLQVQSSATSLQLCRVCQTGGKLSLAFRVLKQ